MDNNSVDYVLLINEKPVLLVEAKPLDDPLNDVKGITQVVGYAANDGIVWCLLTNGVVWKVYRSVEQCPAPEKLMFEVSLDPQAAEGLSAQEMVRQMWRFSREEMAKGAFDAHWRTDLYRSQSSKGPRQNHARCPPRFSELVRTIAGDAGWASQTIKQSLLSRIWLEDASVPSPMLPIPALAPEPVAAASLQSRGAIKAWATRREKATRTFTPYDETHHTQGRPQEVLELYRAIDRLCMALNPGQIERRHVAMTINYVSTKAIFCCVRLLQSGIRVWLKLRYNHLDSPPPFARDVSHLGHYGVGDVELAISTMVQLNEAAPLIRKSYEDLQLAS